MSLPGAERLPDPRVPRAVTEIPGETAERGAKAGGLGQVQIGLWNAGKDEGALGRVMGTRAGGQACRRAGTLLCFATLMV